MTVATSGDLWSDHTGMTEGVQGDGAAAIGREMLRTTEADAAVCLRVLAAVEGGGLGRFSPLFEASLRIKN